MTRTWLPGDRALLPVVVEKEVGEYLRVKWTTAESGVIERGGWANAADLIPDDRRPSWLPGQPGDVAEFEGQRWFRQADNWWFDENGEDRRDDEVPADAVLVLPARTREVAKPTDLRCVCGHTKAAHIYHEGACLPGHPCDQECEKYREVKS